MEIMTCCYKCARLLALFGSGRELSVDLIAVRQKHLHRKIFPGITVRVLLHFPLASPHTPFYLHSYCELCQEKEEKCICFCVCLAGLNFPAPSKLAMWMILIRNVNLYALKSDRSHVN